VIRLTFLAIAVLLCGFSTSALQIQQQYPPRMSPPPPPMNPDNAKQAPDEPKLMHRIDLVQLQREADDLARAAQTIPSDVANVRRGTLPKDVIQKLKEIEKLSKRMRNELNP
jgi:hypothetical protein